MRHQFFLRITFKDLCGQSRDISSSNFGVEKRLGGSGGIFHSHRFHKACKEKSKYCSLYFFRIQNAHTPTFTVDVKGLDAKWHVKLSTQKVPPLRRRFTGDADKKIANSEHCVTRIRNRCMPVLVASLPLLIVFLDVREFCLRGLAECFVVEGHLHSANFWLYHFAQRQYITQFLS
jgi:hypothetical protein